MHPLPVPLLLRRAQRTFAVGACALVVPAALALSSLGFLRAHGAGAAGQGGMPEGVFLVGAAGAAEVCDGRSLCFEFSTAADGPLWVLIQNRGGQTGRSVLVARTPGFEDSHALPPGSKAEQRLLAALRDLASRAEGDDARVGENGFTLLVLERAADS